MPFESIWGFDPEKVAHAEGSHRGESEAGDSSYSTAEEQGARIPADVDSQVYELRRMYRL
jgi:hypothetical protein